MANPEVSVVILTYNGARYIGEVLNSVLGQKTDFPFEVLLIDSGSTDGTLDIARGVPDMGHETSLETIPKEDFNHGDTRNMGASRARGEFVAYLTQDATPLNNGWLQGIRDCFRQDPKIAAVFGKHVPREGCDPITKRDIEGVFLNISPVGEMMVQEASNEADLQALRDGLSPLGFYSDVNSCLRKSFWREHPYPKIDYAEDQVFGREVLLAGFKKVYCPDAAVYHSHNFPPGEFKARYFDEYRGLKKAVGYKEAKGLLACLISAMRGAVRDAGMIKATGQRGGRSGFYWLVFAWRMNYARAIGAYLGGRYESLPGFVTRRLSLEKRGSG